MAAQEIVIDSTSLAQGAAGGVLASVGIFLIALLGLFLIGLYVYHALAWQRIAKNQKYKYPWLAWIPFANVAMIFQLGGFHWALAFLFLIPILGWLAIMVLATISMWRIFERSKYPGWLSLSYALTIIPYLGFFIGVAYFVVIGIVAWEKPQKQQKATTKKKTTKKKATRKK